MLEWLITERTSPSLKEHLKNPKSHLDEYDYGDANLYEYKGFTFPDEQVLKDLEPAVRRIIKAVRDREKIIIFGHDDLDGITSTYILFDFLSLIGSQAHYYYIPNRMQENHGIQEKFIEEVDKQGYSLVITVDGGISSVEGIDRLNSLGCDTIITDHHLVPDELPRAYAIVNPKQADCPYPYDMLAGVGVTFFLVKALSEQLQKELPENYFIWTTIGTIADKAPMTGVNRSLCKIALSRWFEIEDSTLMICPGYNSVKDEYFSKMSFISSVIKTFNNGRDVNGENLALYLLLAPVYKKRELIAVLLPKKNQHENMLHSVKKVIDQRLPKGDELCYIYFDDSDDIPSVLTGWAANYITHVYKIPVLILKKTGDTYNCEARCTEGFNLIEAFNYTSEVLEQYGGHVKAAGFTMKVENAARFEELFRDYVERNKGQILQNRVIKIDAEVDSEELNEIPAILKCFAPYGEGAPEPIFLIRNHCIQSLLEGNGQFSFKTYRQDQLCDIVFSFKQDGKNLILDFKEASSEEA